MMYELVVPQFSKILGNMIAILGEAQKYADEKKFDVGVLLQSRLAPDQFNLIRQVQVACDTAKLGVARLTDTEKSAPAHDDTERTMDEIKGRIEAVIAYLDGFSLEDFATAPARRISQPRWDGKTLSGHEYLVQHVIPNFYFHATMTHAILRHNGVSIGKNTYLGALPFQNPE